ncbi:hypothetical protein [Aurantibacter sp.]|uniref:hypothetical protein n=1 Tax=Aurantibacter sp. TaxID=2807103 RepID=UPI00326728C4
MSINRVNFDTSELGGFSNDLNLNGLERFKKNLERFFISQISIRECITSYTSEVKLVIEVASPWKFSQNVEYFRNSTLSDTGYNGKALLNILAELQEVNDVLIDIEELSLTTEDTTIIIQRIGRLSIARQYDNILRVILNSYNYIVSSIREIPEEIHIPVLTAADNKKEDYAILSDLTTRDSDSEYFSYWGLCYTSDFDTIIYDVKNADFIFEDVTIFPQ